MLYALEVWVSVFYRSGRGTPESGYNTGRSGSVRTKYETTVDCVVIITWRGVFPTKISETLFGMHRYPLPSLPNHPYSVPMLVAIVNKIPIDTYSCSVKFSVSCDPGYGHCRAGPLVDSARMGWPQPASTSCWFAKKCSTVCQIGECSEWLTGLGLLVRQRLYLAQSWHYLPASVIIM